LHNDAAESTLGPVVVIFALVDASDEGLHELFLVYNKVPFGFLHRYQDNAPPSHLNLSTDVVVFALGGLDDILHDFLDVHELYGRHVHVGHHHGRLVSKHGQPSFREDYAHGRGSHDHQGLSVIGSETRPALWLHMWHITFSRSTPVRNMSENSCGSTIILVVWHTRSNLSTRTKLDTNLYFFYRRVSK